MNNRDIEKLKSEFDKTRLTPAEKASMRSELLRFMETTAPGDSQPFGYTRTVSYFVSYIGRPQVYAAFLLLFVVGGSASASALAQKALPGELLYGMKVQVNEQVESALALSVESKIEVETLQATRRLDEAKALKESGKLTPEIHTNLQARFAEKMEVVDKNLNAVASGDSHAAAKLQVNVEKNLDERFESLSALTFESHASDATATTSALKNKPLSATVKAVLKKHEKRKDVTQNEFQKKEDKETTEDETKVSESKIEISSATTSLIEEAVSPIEMRNHVESEVEVHASTTENLESRGVWNRIEGLFKKRSSRARDL